MKLHQVLLSLAMIATPSLASTGLQPAPVVERPLPAAAEAVASKASTELSDAQVDFLREWCDALSMLPLDDLDEVLMTDESLTFRFDFGGDAYRDILLPASESTVLKKGRRGFDLEGGRTARATSDSRKVRVKRELRFEIDLKAGIRSTRKDDLSIYAWLKRRSVNITAFRSVDRLATDDDGRLILQSDGAGQPIRRDGQYVPKAFDSWIRIECSGRTVECGVGSPKDGRKLVR